MSLRRRVPEASYAAAVVIGSIVIGTVLITGWAMGRYSSNMQCTLIYFTKLARATCV